MQKAFNELYKVKGNGATVFDDWFRKDPDGKISEIFALKDPRSPEFDAQPQIRHALNTFLETMFRLKHPTAKDVDLEEAKKTIEYYKVPLTEAVFSRQSKNLGFVEAVKNKVREYKELTVDVFAGDTELKERYERDNDELYNKFDLYDKDRGALISQKGIGFFETHLEIIFNQALVAYTKQQVSRKYVPIFKAMQLGLRHQEEYAQAGTEEHRKLQNIREAVDKFIAQSRQNLENAMKSEFNSYSSKVYDEAKKLVEIREKNKVSKMKQNITELEEALVSKNQELEEAYEQNQVMNDKLLEIGVVINDQPVSSKRSSRSYKDSKDVTEFKPQTNIPAFNEDIDKVIEEIDKAIKLIEV